MKKIVVLVFLFVSNFAFGYVENASHGYVNCMACHISPNGGGVLNEYGRSLSKELMSTWGWKDAEHPLFGAVKNTKNLLIGGDYRRIQTRLDNNKVKVGKSFTMEANVELAYRATDSLILVGALGVQGGPDQVENKGDVISERHYLLYSVDTTKLKIGKFRHHFGLNDPTHTRLTKTLFGFGAGTESYIVEWSQFYETGELFLSSDFGRIDNKVEEESEKSLSINYAHYLFEKNKIGFSYMYGEKDKERRSLFNMSSLFSTPFHTYIKFENTFQTKYQPEKREENYNSYGMNLTFGSRKLKGFTPYLVTELGQSDLDKSTTRTNVYGVGANFLPIPHFELNFEAQRRKTRSSGKVYSDFGFLILHFYI